MSRAPVLVDDRAIGDALAARGLASGAVRVEPVGDGHSNLTYLVTDAHGARLVLRRPPAPPLPPGANDVLREARFLAALAGSGVPVPRVLGVFAAGELFDVPAYAMTYVPGPVVTVALPAPLDSPGTRREIGRSLVDTLAALHAVDWRTTSVAELGRPEGFTARQLRRMSRLVADANGAPAPEFAPLHDWLRANLPAEGEASLLHNDYRLGNVILAPVAPGRVAGILDWELAAVGDPLIDLGYLLSTVPEPGHEPTPTQTLSAAMTEPGWPTRAELAERYAETSGRSVADLSWYVALAHWKVAALYEYSARRAAAGDGDGYYVGGRQVALFLEAGAREAGIG